MTLRVDGVTQDTTDVTGITCNNSSSKFTIGRNGEYALWYYNGWIDELRFTKGAARHTTDYTPAVAAYEDVITEGILTSDRVAVSASTDYLITTYIKNTGLAGTISAVLKWYDDPAAGSLLQTETIGLVNTSGSFQEYSISSESPATAESCEVILTCSSTNAYEINFDTISISALTVNQKLQLTDDGLATTNGLYPKRLTLMGDELMASGAVTNFMAASQRYGYHTFVTTPANGSWFTGGGMLRKGTYSIKALVVTANNQGKFDIYLDDVLVSSGNDDYSGVSTYNVLIAIGAINVTYSGYHTLKLLVNGKNGSSSNYYLSVTKVWMHQATD